MGRIYIEPPRVRTASNLQAAPGAEKSVASAVSAKDVRFGY
jgi:hypothetical protein